MAKPKTKELGLEGQGVAPVSIPQVDRLAEAYIKERDKRLQQTPKEVAAKTKLIEALHFHADKIRLPDGSLVYRFDELVVTLEPGKEKLKVASITRDEENYEAE